MKNKNGEATLGMHVENVSSRVLCIVLGRDGKCKRNTCITLISSSLIRYLTRINLREQWFDWQMSPTVSGT